MSYLLGLVGHPVKHSLSPALHHSAFSYLGLSGNYQLIDLTASALKDGIERLVDGGFCGFNVTIPHKQAVCGLMAELTVEARQVGAVNTVKVESQRHLVGHNTDVCGFGLALSNLLKGRDTPSLACILGGGGAARSAVAVLRGLGLSRIYLVTRDAEKGRALIEAMDPKAAEFGSNRTVSPIVSIDPTLSGLESPPDLVVNCTPIGLHEDRLPRWLTRLINLMGPKGAVFDMVYSRGQRSTPLVDFARHLQLVACDGSEMLIEQARQSFNFWTGRTVPFEIVHKALQDARLVEEASILQQGGR